MTEAVPENDNVAVTAIRPIAPPALRIAGDLQPQAGALDAYDPAGQLGLGHVARFGCGIRGVAATGIGIEERSLTLKQPPAGRAAPIASPARRSRDLTADGSDTGRSADALSGPSGHALSVPARFAATHAS